MSERAVVTSANQIGVETTPGTAVAANKRLQATSMMWKPSGNINQFRPEGYKFPTIAAIGKEWAEADIRGYGSYPDLSYLFAGLIGYAAPTRNIPSTGLSYTWEFTPNTNAEDTIKTFTVEEGSSVRAHKVAYTLIDEIELSWDRGKVDLRGHAIGQRLTDGVTLTATPTEIEAVPILGNQIDIFLDAASGDLGTTQLLRVLSGSFRYGSRYKTLWPVNSSLSSFGAHYEGEPEAIVRLTLEADSNGMALLDTMRAGGTQFLRIKASGPNIELGYDYGLTIDLAGKITEPPPLADTDGLVTVEWTMKASHDATWGKAFTVSLVNLVASL